MSKPSDTIDLQPNWKSAARMCLLLLSEGTEEGKQNARAELLRMGGLMDTLIDERNARFNADTNTEKS